MAIPIPEEEYIRKVLGDTLEVTIGAGQTNAFVAIGTDGLPSLKRQIDGSKQQGQASVDPFFGEVALSPILKFAESVEPNPLVRSLSAMIADQPDRIHVRARATERGAANYRLTLEEGVLGVIGQGAQMMGINGGGF